MKEHNVSLLDVPWVSQIGVGAGKFNNDCGAACVAMLIRAYTGKEITVDECYEQTGQTIDAYLSFRQLEKVLEASGIAATYHRLCTQNFLTGMLLSQRPLIVLFNYGVFRKYVETWSAFAGMHFAVVAGLDTKHVFILDPLNPTDVAQPVRLPLAEWEKIWRQSGAQCIVPDVDLDRFEALPVLYRARVLVSGLRIRTSPGVRNDNWTGHSLSLNSIVSVYAVSEQDGNLWFAIDNKENHRQWCAAEYRGKTYAERIKENA